MTLLAGAEVGWLRDRTNAFDIGDEFLVQFGRSVEFGDDGPMGARERLLGIQFRVRYQRPAR